MRPPRPSPRRFWSWFFLYLLHLIWGGLLLSFCLSSYAAAQENVTIAQTPLAVQGGSAAVTGHYDPNNMLRLVFTLRPPHLQDEEQFLSQLQDPQSPLFHRYLSEQEWDERFAPAPQDEQAVVTWAQSQDLTITQRYANRLLVEVEAPSAVIERALDISINTYRMGEEVYFSNDRDPSVPARLGGVIHSVLGLNNIEVVHTFSNRSQDMRPPDYTPGPAYAVGPHIQRNGNPLLLRSAMQAQAGGLRRYGAYGPYSPADLYSANAYDYSPLQLLGICCNPTNNPNNSLPQASIAIAIWGDFNDSDLDGFLNSFPYLASNVQRYFVGGTPSCCYPETTLDVEWSTAMANSFHLSSDTAQINVYEGTNNSPSIMLAVVNRILSDGYARVLSMSWGGAENSSFTYSQMENFHTVFNQMLGQGWTLVASSGDGGATAGCENRLAASYPASDPDVTAAGGTTLTLNPGGSYGSEIGWSGGVYGCAANDGGSGGGCSVHFAAPGYQSNLVCGAQSRSVPDIALNADWANTPQDFFFNGQMEGNGGTSIVSPEIAGFFAQENAYLLRIQSLVGDTCGPSLSAPCSPLGNANPYLYYEGLHAPLAPHYPFYDITRGCNGNDITQKYNLTPYCSAVGYDQVTGWGSANMLQLAWTMNNFLAGDAGGPSIAITGPPINHWYNVDETVSWTMTDTTGNGHLPNGVAGSSQAWDADPGDPYSEPTPGYGGSYYGPQFPGSSGSAGGLYDLSQGCHTAYVRAWDNAGQSQVANYGSLCFDSIPPVTTITLSGNGQGQTYTGPVLVSISATDNASGVASTNSYVDQNQFQYSGPFYVYLPGYHCVQAYSVDVATNVETLESSCFVIQSNQQFTLSVSKAGTGSGTVTSTDGGINCGSTCSASYYDEQPVTLTATQNQGSAFSGWSGCDISFGYSCTSTITAARHVTATFNIPVALQFIPVNPCRVADTRWPDGPFGGPALQGGSSRNITIPNSPCDIPPTAAAYSLNVTVVPHGDLGFLTVWPSGEDRPLISTMNSVDGRIKANAAIVPAGSNEAISVYASSTTDVVLDIDGYFVPAPAPSALAFYPLSPCRVADTRKPDGPLGGPSLVAQQQRDLPVLSSSCGIPNTALAYSMNFTAVPKDGASVWIFTAWPAGQSQPATSTLNAPTGTIVANAAIVSPGTNGDIDVWASNNTDLVVDIDGYFAAPAAGGLSLYSNVPCRVLDTRKTTGAFTGLTVVNVVNANCGAPTTAQAFVLNATVVPDGPLGYLTLWPDGGNQPTVSTLNALDGIITSNMAIVPTTNGSIDAYASGLTNLVLDISSYFAP